MVPAARMAGDSVDDVVEFVDDIDRWIDKPCQ
jgi:hypothetical protein